MIHEYAKGYEYAEECPKCYQYAEGCPKCYQYPYGGFFPASQISCIVLLHPLQIPFSSSSHTLIQGDRAASLSSLIVRKMYFSLFSNSSLVMFPPVEYVIVYLNYKCLVRCPVWGNTICMVVGNTIEQGVCPPIEYDHGVLLSSLESLLVQGGIVLPVTVPAELTPITCGMTTLVYGTLFDNGAYIIRVPVISHPIHHNLTYSQLTDCRLVTSLVIDVQGHAHESSLNHSLHPLLNHP